MESLYQCAPGRLKGAKANDGTCLPPASIRRLVKSWNRTHKNKISAKGTRKNTSTLWHKLRSAMAAKYKCDTEYCAAKKLNASKDDLVKYFKPDRPKEWDADPKLWLDTENIEKVMKQYEDAVPEFAFLGAVPIDFDKTIPEWGQCVSNEMCKLNLAQSAKKGKNKIGVIFNLDPHDKPGSHWVAAFVDIPKKTAYYYDSYGYKPEQQIENFLQRCQEQGCTNVYYNDIRHQRSHSECGTYCMYVILNLLGGRPYRDVCEDIVSDDVMNTFRDVLFAEETPRRAAIEKALPVLQKLRLV